MSCSTSARLRVAASMSWEPPLYRRPTAYIAHPPPRSPPRRAAALPSAPEDDSLGRLPPLYRFRTTCQGVEAPAPSGALDEVEAPGLRWCSAGAAREPARPGAAAGSGLMARKPGA